MDTNEQLLKEYQKVIDKLFDKITKKDDEIKELQKVIARLEKQTNTLSKLCDKIIKKVGE